MDGYASKIASAEGPFRKLGARISRLIPQPATEILSEQGVRFGVAHGVAEHQKPHRNGCEPSGPAEVPGDQWPAKGLGKATANGGEGRNRTRDQPRIAQLLPEFLPLHRPDEPQATEDGKCHSMGPGTHGVLGKRSSGTAVGADVHDVNLLIREGNILEKAFVGGVLVADGVEVLVLLDFRDEGAGEFDGEVYPGGGS